MDGLEKPKQLDRQLRVLATVKRLGLEKPWVLVTDIVHDLQGQGYTVEKYHVRRDLQALEEIYNQLESNVKKGEPTGYRWVGHDAPPETGMSLPEALSLVLVRDYLRQALPSTLTSGLNSIFRLAEKTLDLQKANPPAKWADKIHVVQPMQPLLPPNTSDSIVNDVHFALANEEKIKIDYRNARGEKKVLTLDPLGLIQRGPISYLIALGPEHEEPRLYALHRILKSYGRTWEPARKIEGFKVAEYAAKEGHFGEILVMKGKSPQSRGEVILLRARVTGDLAGTLKETKLSEEQELFQDETEWWLLAAPVQDTIQLWWWILSQGAKIEVLEPVWLRELVIDERDMLRELYHDGSNIEAT